MKREREGNGRQIPEDVVCHGIVMVEFEITWEIVDEEKERSIEDKEPPIHGVKPNRPIAAKSQACFDYEKCYEAIGDCAK